jgi:hypothetical protein
MARRVRHHIVRAGRAVGRGTRGAALQVIAGLVAGVGHSAAASRVDFVQKNWWSGPVILGVVGLLARKSRRLSGAGDALLGAAGYAGYMAYTVAHANAPAASAGTQGVWDDEASDVGFLSGGGGYRAPGLDAYTQVPTAPQSSAIPVSASVDTVGLM